jgi:hypothetical protein
LSSTKRLPFVVSDTQRKDNSGTLTVTIARR